MDQVLEPPNDNLLHHPRLDSVVQYFDSLLRGGTVQGHAILVVGPAECKAWQRSTPLPDCAAFGVDSDGQVIVVQDPASQTSSSSGTSYDNERNVQVATLVELIRNRFIDCLACSKWITVFDGESGRKIWSAPLLAPHEPTQDLGTWAALRKVETTYSDLIAQHQQERQRSKFKANKRKDCCCVSCVIICFFFLTLTAALGILAAVLADSQL